MEQHLFFELIDKYLSGKASQEESKLLEEYYRRLDKSKTSGLTAGQEKALQGLMLENIIKKIGEGIPIVPIRKKINRFKRYTAAAAILLFALLTAYIYFKPTTQNLALIQKVKRDVLPGGNKAILTLNNGQKIILNNARNGNLALQGLTAIRKTANGQVTYQLNRPDTGQSIDNAISYNTVTTPRGGQYRVKLPDGTDVWLNAVSSIRFPVAFTGKERKVTITGEVYFEVAKNKAKPFIVTSGGQTVTVLGTHFNIMAYPEEGTMVTTLLEGSVKIAKGNEIKILKPGQKAVVNEDIKVTEADTEDAVAWKNGITSFEDADIKTIMRKISRWYDIDIEYQGPLSDRVFTGAISRKSNLSGILKILALNHIQFSLENGKLIVKQ